jgi:1-acyl-sn-glycerol-3-phosphate acyltransferase
MNWPTDWLGTLAIVAIVLALAIAAGVAALPWLIRPYFFLLLWPRYRIRVRGLEHLPKSGPVLLASNHMTWIDGFLLAAIVPRRANALVNADFFRLPVIGFLARRGGLIPVPFSGPRAQRAAIEAARAALDSGVVLAIFPEAQLSRNGLTGPFYRGLEVILAGRDHVPVVPVFLDNLWGSLFSFSEGRFLKKWPQGLRRTVNIAFGPPLPPPVTAFAVRQAILEAGVRAAELRRKPAKPLETVDPALPHLDDPTLGPLTGSTADYDQNGIRQTGHKPGSVGHPLPGVALRVVDDAGHPLTVDTEGRLQALVPGLPDWAETGHRARLDRDGFVHLAGAALGDGPAQSP